MIKILKNIELYVGTKEEYDEAEAAEMSIVCAMNTGDGVSYRSVFGKTTAEHPNYLYGSIGNTLFLNLIDANDVKYIPKPIIRTALNFIDQELNKGNSVFVYCSLGESRSPSIALMYLMEYGKIPKNSNAISIFYHLYPKYNPGNGMKKYIYENYLMLK